MENDPTDITCAYCGDRATEWDHLRPIISNQEPTGYITSGSKTVPRTGSLLCERRARISLSGHAPVHRNDVDHGACLSPLRRPRKPSLRIMDDGWFTPPIASCVIVGGFGGPPLSADKEVRIFPADPVLQQRLAKYLVLQCFRNSTLEDFHAGYLALISVRRLLRCYGYQSVLCDPLAESVAPE